MKKYILPSVIIVVIIAVVLSILLGTPQKKNTDITISQVGDFVLYLPLYVAQDKGFFQEQGLNVTIVSSGGDDKAFASVISGQAQFAQGDPVFVAISKEKGGPGKAVGVIVNKAPFWMVSTKNITISTPKDFKGKKIVTYLAPSTAYTLTVKLGDNNGLKLGQDYNIIQSQFGSELGPLFSGEADATLTIPPTVQEAVDKGAKIVYSYPNEFGDMTVTGLTTTDEYIKNNPEVVQKVVTAYQNALNYIYANPDEATQIAINRFPNLNKVSVKDTVYLAINESVWPRRMEINHDAWDKAIQIRVSIGDIKTAPQFTDVVDNSFANNTK